ncbi:MAG: phosphatase PAP2 family protein [Chloroflexi bacterium]|nr:phosphatase PAP2 family protein [Chloroflexota bacterium]
MLKAVTNGWGVIRLETALAINYEAFIQQVIGRISLGALIGLTYFYVAGMWLGLIGTAVFTFIKDRAAYVDLRRTFVLTMIFGAIVFALYPLAPPRFMPGFGMTDTVTLLGLDPAPHSDSTISYNRFAAMPSLHYAWALLVMIAAFRVGGLWFKVGGFLYQAVMFVAIIATANHYVLDAVAGALLLVVAMYVNRWWNYYDHQMSQWTSDQLSQLRELDHKWRRRIGSMQVPDLREQFLSGFILRGGHAIQPRRSQITTAQTKLPTANVQQSFRPELNNLSLVLN